MDVEILLDRADAVAKDHDLINKRFMEWYNEGAEVRHNKISFGVLERLNEDRYHVDIGYADLIKSFQNLHARLHRLGVKVFIHFLP